MKEARKKTDEAIGRAYETRADIDCIGAIAALRDELRAREPEQPAAPAVPEAEPDDASNVIAAWASRAEAAEREVEEMSARNRAACQTLVDALGADAPVNVEGMAARAVATIAELRIELGRAELDVQVARKQGETTVAELQAEVERGRSFSINNDVWVRLSSLVAVVVLRRKP